MKSKKKNGYLKSVLVAAPLLLLSVVLFYGLAVALGIDINWAIAAYGALGWWIALLLRAPIVLIAKSAKLSPEKLRTLTIAASGPCEEVVRLAALLILGRTLGYGYSLGLGWAAIEAVYALVQAVAMGALQNRTDAKAKEAKRFLHEQGLDKSLGAAGPLAGVLERIGANGIHIGFSLLIVFSPWLTLIAMPLHSTLNFYILKTIKKSLWLAEAGFMLLGSVVWAVGLALAR